MKELDMKKEWVYYIAMVLTIGGIAVLPYIHHIAQYIVTAICSLYIAYRTVIFIKLHKSK